MSFKFTITFKEIEKKFFFRIGSIYTAAAGG
mgnify:CR=1 FL=1